MFRSIWRPLIAVMLAVGVSALQWAGPPSANAHDPVDLTLGHALGVAAASASPAQTVAPPPGAKFVQISAGYVHTCALDDTGTITCWGMGEDGATTVPPGTYRSVSAGQDFTCAIRTDQTLVCWGWNGSGQTNAPAGSYLAVASGANHACAIKSEGPGSGPIVCWGYNAYGQATPPTNDQWTAVAGGFRHSCAIRTDGMINCWGANDEGQAPSYQLGPFSDLGAGGWHSCGLDSAGNVACWGYNGDGQINAPSGSFTSLGVGFYHNCAIRSTGTLACWGYNGEGEASPPAGTFTGVSAGLYHSCAIQNGAAVCWGWNYYNQCGPVATTPATYVPVTPTRLLDTRYGNGLSGKFQANQARTFQIAGRGPVPANAVAVTGNLTVTGQTYRGFVALTPLATNNPTTSTLNFPVGDNRANNVTVSLAPAGTLAAVYKAPNGQTANVLFDVTGYFVAADTGATYKSAGPVRLLDTRYSNGLSGAFVSGTPRTWPIAGRGGIPAGATAITGNVTVTGQTGAGYVALGPVATSSPSTSTLNFPLGDNRANGLTVKLAPDGTLSAVYKGPAGARTQLILDVTGYYLPGTSGARFYRIPPARLLDTRDSTGLDTSLTANVAQTLVVANRIGIPTGVVGLTGNLTVVGQTKAGYLSMTAATTNTPSTSTLNFPVGDIRANGVTGPLSPGGTVGLVYRATAPATANVILDVTGYFK